MLRHYEQHEGGVKVYTRNLLPRLFTIAPDHEYVLMYQSPALIGTYSSYPNVEEVALRVPGRFLWDQWAAPWIANRKRVDVLFNFKFTVPFFSRVKKVFVIHGSEWFTIPEAFLWHDRWYFRIFVPLYIHRADAIISVAQTVKDDVVRFAKVPASKVTAVHNGYDRSRFRPIHDGSVLDSVRRKLGLPERFVLWAGQIYPPKNVGRLLEAFAQIKDQVPHALVLAGETRWRAKEEFRRIRELGLEDRIHFAGWVSHEDLPAVYSLADLFAFPSLYEGFGIPLLEAMACGCPVLTSRTGSPPEVVDSAGCLVDPLRVDEIASRMREILMSAPLRQEMAQRGLERVKAFSWERCARETLAVLEATSPAGGAGSS